MYQQTVGYHNLLTRESGPDRVQADGALVCSRHLQIQLFGTTCSHPLGQVCTSG
jgi:hypothetical protein